MLDAIHQASNVRNATSLIQRSYLWPLMPNCMESVLNSLVTNMIRSTQHLTVSAFISTANMVPVLYVSAAHIILIARHNVQDTNANVTSSAFFRV